MNQWLEVLMIESKARIVHSDNNSLYLEVDRQHGCNSCSHNQGCGTHLFSTSFGTSNKKLSLHVAKDGNTPGEEAGSDIILGISERSLVMASLITYLLPLISFIAGGMAGFSMAPEMSSGEIRDFFTVAGSIMGLVAGFILTRRLLHWYGFAHFKPEILKNK